MGPRRVSLVSLTRAAPMRRVRPRPTNTRGSRSSARANDTSDSDNSDNDDISWDSSLGPLLGSLLELLYSRVKGARQLIEKGTITSKDVTLVEYTQQLLDLQAGTTPKYSFKDPSCLRSHYARSAPTGTSLAASALGGADPGDVGVSPSNVMFVHITIHVRLL